MQIFNSLTGEVILTSSPQEQSSIAPERSLAMAIGTRNTGYLLIHSFPPLIEIQLSNDI